MTELEMIERAKMYMDKLANGVNPIDDTLAPEEDIINNDSSLGIKGGFDPDRFEVYQVPQKEVERLTDLHFGNIGDITEQPMRLTAENDYAPKLA